MKAVILAGGLGTRISEESHLKPKPMIEIGGKPILWHIMKQYSAHGIHDFVICLGYKGRSEEHTSELQSLMRISYAVFCLNKKTLTQAITNAEENRRQNSQKHK